MQHKLDFISEPSSTAEDSRAKQAVADKLMRVLRQEEHKMTSRLTTTDPVIPTPRHFDSDNQASGGGGGPKRGFRRKKTNNEQSKQMTNDLMPPPPPPPVSSLQSLTTQIMTLTASAKDAEIQKLRITQMKTLRREIRKLEKIEALRLAQEAQSGISF